MNQHPRAKEMGLAAETAEFTFDEKMRDWCIDCGANHIATVYPNVDETAPETEIMADSLNVMNQTGRTPSELVREWDKWEDEATRLNGENEKLKDLVRELAGAIASINRAPHHVVEVDGDDDICYYQRKEWVDWIIQLADDAMEVVT
jgi:hypothetical protein